MTIKHEGLDIPIKTSYSAVSTFEHCPHAYRIQYLEGLAPTGFSLALAVGEAIHEFLSLYAQRPDLDVSEYQNRFLEAFASSSNWDNQDDGFQYLDIVTNYIGQNKALTPLMFNGLPFVEKWVQIHLGKADFKEIVRTRVDIVNKDFCLIDYKTSSTGHLNQKEIDNTTVGMGLQASLMSIGIAQIFGKIPAKIGFRAVRTKAGKTDKTMLGTIIDYKTTRTVIQLKEVNDFYMDKLIEISKSDFPYGTSPKCYYCNLKGTELCQFTKTLEVDNSWSEGMF